MSGLLTDVAVWLRLRGDLVVPLVLAAWIAWEDVRTRRIPNYLTLGIAVTGLLYSLLSHGWMGLLSGVLGLALGFGFLLLPYLLGGMGAGDVKALAALGTWLGPWGTVFLFCYMGIAGGLMALGVLLWKGLLRLKLRQGWINATNAFLCRSAGALAPSLTREVTPGMPYGVAIMVGMAVLLVTVR